MSKISRRAVVAGAAAATALGAVGPINFAARAAAPISNKPSSGFYRYKIGDYEVTAIYDGIWLPDVGPNLVPNAPLSDLQKALAEAFAPPGKLPVPIVPMVVNTGSKLVALDTGSGGRWVPTTGSYMENFAAAGFDPKAIDTIVISHFHPDHISGIRTKDDQLTFPNAEILVPAQEWAFWMDDAKMNAAPDAAKPVFANVRRVFGSIAKDVKQFEPGKEVAPGIQSIPAFGHTPGHTAFMIASGSQSLLHIVDSTNNPHVWARYPEWQFGFDADRARAVENRKKLLDQAVTDRLLVAGYHWPFPGIGYVVKEGSGYRVVPASWL